MKSRRSVHGESGAVLEVVLLRFTQNAADVVHSHCRVLGTLIRDLVEGGSYCLDEVAKVDADLVSGSTE